MTSNPKADFFDSIADKWDGWEDLEGLMPKLQAGLDELGLTADESVLDVGCGTGNLTAALLGRLSFKGRVAAVDISPQMIEIARHKIQDARSVQRIADVKHLPFDDASFHRAICYSVWPHFDNKKAAVRELCRVLKPNGALHVWHSISRERVNEIHADASPAVCNDLLEPAERAAGLLRGMGFQVTAAIDTEDRYLVSAIKKD